MDIPGDILFYEIMKKSKMLMNKEIFNIVNIFMFVHIKCPLPLLEVVFNIRE